MPTGDELPEYLRAFGDVDQPLKGFDKSDGPEGNKKPKATRAPVDQQMSQIVRPMPQVQMAPLGGRGRDPDWLLRGEPRAVQSEALRRSMGGFWLKQGQDDVNERGYRLVDGGGLGRTGPARGWAHFMEQRLGKTPVLLNEFGLLRRDYGSKFGVIFSPNQFKPEWADEADRFGLDCPAYVFNSNERHLAQRWVDRNRRHGGLIAINYEAALSRETLSFIENISGPQELIAFDESVSVKNDSGVLAKNCLQTARLFGWRRDLTGKPVVQGPQDLYMQLKMLGALDGVNPYAFRNRFCKMGGFQGKKVLGVRDERVEELNELLVAWGFLARRTNWLTTPGSEYAKLKFEMIREQRVHYNRMEKDFITELEREGFDPLVISADQIITKLLKLQQIASGFIIDEQGKAHDIMPPSSNPKLQAVKGFLRDQASDKVIIFAHYTHSIELLAEALGEFNPAFIVGAGQAKRFGVDVQSEKRKFNGDRSCRVVIGQEQAIRYGHTLMGAPGDPCLTGIFYENNYSLNDRSQCEERPQGKGQEGLVTLYDMEGAPIDHDIIEALRLKEDISSVVLNYARSTGVLPH